MAFVGVSYRKETKARLNMSDDEGDAGPVPDIAMTPIDPTKKSVQFKLANPLKLGDFEQGVTLGTGSFGRVNFVTHKVRSNTHMCAAGCCQLYVCLYACRSDRGHLLRGRFTFPLLKDCSLYSF